ncbi:hypothetical protein [Nocardia salmonicida]|uniref:hypothetical protein n=1 Tax=Nocardia salmonicida TaxID=53431 RepID=UPI0037AEBC43
MKTRIGVDRIATPAAAVTSSNAHVRIGYTRARKTIGGAAVIDDAMLSIAAASAEQQTQPACATSAHA